MKRKTVIIWMFLCTFALLAGCGETYQENKSASAVLDELIYATAKIFMI